MNLFKVTLLGTMVAGLACANVSAVMRPPVYWTTQSTEQTQNSETSNVTPPATEEEVLAVLEELKEVAAQHGIVVTNELGPLGYLTASGICATGAMLTGKALSGSLWLFRQLARPAMVIISGANGTICLNSLDNLTGEVARMFSATGNIPNSAITCPSVLSEAFWKTVSALGSGISIGALGSLTVILGVTATICLFKSIDKLGQEARQVSLHAN